jgi:hypothetical protein
MENQNYPLTTQKRGMKYILVQSLLMFCCIFTAATLFSSGYQLLSGTESDTNFHILLRGMITLVGVVVWQSSLKSNFKFRVLNIVIPYGVSLMLVFGIVFVAGFFEELHKDAYRDIFLNFTIAFAIVTAIIRVTVFMRSKKRR